MGNLSKDFSDFELACSHCGKLIVRTPFIAALQEFRDLAGRPVYITGGYRCKANNDAVGGATNSRHLHGDAADCRILGANLLEMQALAMKVDAFYNGGIGIYPDQNRLHVDTRPSGPARWGVIGSKYMRGQEGYDKAMEYLLHKMKGG
jgi:hypothetical protein